MKEKTKKGVNIALGILTALIVAFTVCMLVFTVVSVAPTGRAVRTTANNDPSGDAEISTSPLCFVDYARAL